MQLVHALNAITKKVPLINHQEIAMTRFEVKKLNLPRIHNPLGWCGEVGGFLITHAVWDNVSNEEFTSFGSFHAAESHAKTYNKSILLSTRRENSNIRMINK